MTKSLREQYAALPLELRLAAWREAMPEPRVCETCVRWVPDGSARTCERFGTTPPEDFQKTENACDEWEGVPF